MKINYFYSAVRNFTENSVNTLKGIFVAVKINYTCKIYDCNSDKAFVYYVVTFAGGSPVEIGRTDKRITLFVKLTVYFLTP